MSHTVYGLPNCDTCRKARNWLQRFGVDHDFVDYRTQPVAAERLRAWAGRLGGFDALINRASSTWRNLPGNRKAPGSEPEWLLLIREYPALVKRPVLEGADGSVTLGFSDAAWKRLLLP
ncbi:MAG: Spx/MgsR family RNA polymerase-binding regulatory protein [Xanthomonadales bacterium]|nr:Spx/MgsR family RNA polymerase-binding regulatory protein [Xanthomonadales bacterium]